MWSELIYIKSFYVGHHLCAILTLKNKDKSTTKWHPASSHQPSHTHTHTHTIICTSRQIIGGLYMAFLSSSHFQITHWMPKSYGHSEWSYDTGDRKTLCFWRDRLAKPVTILVKIVARRGKNKLSSKNIKYSFFDSFPSNYCWVILHTYPQLTQCCSNGIILWVNTPTIWLWQYQKLILKHCYRERLTEITRLT